MLMQKMDRRMYEKLEKYWADFSSIMAVLDPRYKCQIVEWGYEKIYGNGYKYEVAIIKEKLFSLYKEYVDESNVNTIKVGHGLMDPQEGSQDSVEVASASLLMVCIFNDYEFFFV